MAGDTTHTTILMMAGYAGSGKTTLAREIQARTGIDFLSKDELKRENLAAGADPYLAGWEAHISLIEYVKRHCLCERKSLIIDCSNQLPFLLENILHALFCLESEKRFSVHLKTIFCVAPQEDRARRLARRGSVFAPYITSLPRVRRDEEILIDFAHLFAEQLEVRAQLDVILTNKLFQFETFSSEYKNLLVVNTAFHTDVFPKIMTMLA